MNVHNTASFHTSNNMFNEEPETGNHCILGFVRGTEFFFSGLFLWVIRQDVRRFKPLEAGILQEDTARRKRLVFLITNAFVVDASSKRPTEIAYTPLFNVNNEMVLHGMRFFLPL